MKTGIFVESNSNLGLDRGGKRSIRYLNEAFKLSPTGATDSSTGSSISIKLNKYYYHSKS